MRSTNVAEQKTSITLVSTDLYRKGSSRMLRCILNDLVARVIASALPTMIHHPVTMELLESEQ